MPFILASRGGARLRRADGLSDYSTSSYSKTNIQISVTVSSKSIWPLSFGNLYIVLRVSAAPIVVLLIASFY